MDEHDVQPRQLIHRTGVKANAYYVWSFNERSSSVWESETSDGDNGDGVRAQIKAARSSTNGPHHIFSRPLFLLQDLYSSESEAGRHQSTTYRSSGGIVEQKSSSTDPYASLFRRPGPGGKVDFDPESWFWSACVRACVRLTGDDRPCWTAGRSCFFPPLLSRERSCGGKHQVWPLEPRACSCIVMFTCWASVRLVLSSTMV